MNRFATAFATEAQTITVGQPLPGISAMEGVPDYTHWSIDVLVGKKTIDQLPVWVPRVVGKVDAVMGGSISQVTTRRIPFSVTNYGHGHCRYCSYKLTHDLDGDGPDPHMVDVWANKPDRMTVNDCHCSCVHEYECSDGALYRYVVSVVRQLDYQRSLLRVCLRSGTTHDQLE